MTICKSFALIGALLSATPAASASLDDLDRLFDAIGTPRLIEIMRIEGLSQADEMQQSMFPGRSGWDAIASSIYSTQEMTTAFRTLFDAELANTDAGPLLDFFASDLGRRIVGLELSGREALLEPDVEAAAKVAYERLVADDPDRAALIGGFIDANDLIELNVMGGLNASLAFYTGLTEGGGFEMSQQDILTDVWSSEPDLRAETEEWITSYLSMAYQPLTDSEIEAYTRITSGPEGRDLNRALFAGFDAVFNGISYDLGRAASRFASGEDI